VAAPMPLDAPVMTMTLFVMFIGALRTLEGS
jgi:hypothetical protein